jgi:ATP-dependent Clp protease, protease subunit
MTTSEGAGAGMADVGWLREKLFERRTVLLTGDLAEAASRCAAELMTLDATADAPIDLRIDCHGGGLDAALAVIDVVDLVGVPVHATCIGRADGPVAGVLAVADHRLAAPHALIRLHEGEPAAFEGRAADLAALATAHRAQLDGFCERVAEACGQPVATIADLVDRRRPIDPHEALRLGIVDEVADRDAEIRLFPRRVGFQLRR